jgi:hypothetical protein
MGERPTPRRATPNPWSQSLVSKRDVRTRSTWTWSEAERQNPKRCADPGIRQQALICVAYQQRPVRHQVPVYSETRSVYPPTSSPWPGSVGPTSIGPGRATPLIAQQMTCDHDRPGKSPAPTATSPSTSARYSLRMTPCLRGPIARSMRRSEDDVMPGDTQ